MQDNSARYCKGLPEAVDRILQVLGNDLVVGLPLGIGKPNPLVNALYRRACDDHSIRLKLFTALSLEIPVAGSDLERRFLGPFIERHFGKDYPSLQYVCDLRQNSLPPNVTVSEFYLQSGAWLDVPHAQRNYISSNYTHVARDMCDMGVNLVLQMVAAAGTEAGRRYSLSGNPDVTLDLLQRLREMPERNFMLVAQVNEQLPFMTGDAEVGREFFDLIVDDRRHDFAPYAPPRASVSIADYAIGMHASSLVRDGGTLQLGIGALGDAVVRAMLLRHASNDDYLRVLDGLCGDPEVRRKQCRIGGDGNFTAGLYAATEMFTDGFMHLYRAGILKRRVYQDIAVQSAVLQGRSPAELGARFGEEATRGSLLHAAFFVGSVDFYRWLRDLSAAEREEFRMTSVSNVNELYGNHQQLEQLQRRDARFINSTMKVTLLGAAVSDALEDQRVVSGVGGQYNFVAMAHALRSGRSILMLRSGRESGRGRESNIVWSYGHTTVPRHLRDIVVTEYGVADLRGKTDEDVIKTLLAVSDARDQPMLMRRAKEAGKLAGDYAIPELYCANSPAKLHAIIGQWQAAGPKGLSAVNYFPDYPFGCDFTREELRLLAALKSLKRDVASLPGLVRLAGAVIRSSPSRQGIQDCLRRMGLESASGFKGRLQRRLLAATLPRDAPTSD
jgi:acyl-CoA hydrolase